MYIEVRQATSQRGTKINPVLNLTIEMLTNRRMLRRTSRTTTKGMQTSMKERINTIILKEIRRIVSTASKGSWARERIIGKIIISIMSKNQRQNRLLKNGTPLRTLSKARTILLKRTQLKMQNLTNTQISRQGQLRRPLLPR
jgi:hypothetical protein